MKIRYEFADGKTIEIEVLKGLGEISIAIDKEICNSDRRETRRHSSISGMEEQGIQFPDETQDIQAIVENRETIEKLSLALEKLLPRQRELIFSVFFEGKPIADIAREEGVTEAAVRNRLRKIYKKLKTFFD